MQKIFFFLFPILTLFLSKTSHAQIIDTPIEHYVFIKNRDYKLFLIKGRVIGTNLKNVDSVTILNIRTAEKTNANNLGFFEINAAREDTISFEIIGRLKNFRIIKHPDEKLNVILIKRKTDGLNLGSNEYKKAQKEDDELYRILEKDAKLEGKWNY